MKIALKVPLYLMFPVTGCGPWIRLFATSKGILTQQASVPAVNPIKTFLANSALGSCKRLRDCTTNFPSWSVHSVSAARPSASRARQVRVGHSVWVGAASSGFPSEFDSFFKKFLSNKLKDKIWMIFDHNSVTKYAVRVLTAYEVN